MMQQSVLSQAFQTFDAIEGICEKYNPSGLAPIREMVAQRRASPAASIMVYGVYNAGKSTLINALLGEADRAKVADRPETDKVSKYQWREFEILDTPGIDAPIQHEEVTQAQLHSTDVVIFVVNPLGVVEEAGTLSTLLDLVERRKKIVLVLNCKNKLEPMDAERIKDELRQRLQDMAAQKGLHEVLQFIPILEVNARTALKAKVEGKQNLLASSGLPLLERELYKFLSSVDQQDIVRAFVSELTGLLDETLRLLDQQSDSASTARIDEFYADIARREMDLRASLKALADARSAFVEKRAFSIISSSQDNAQERIAELVQSAGSELLAELESELRRLVVDASVLLDEMLESVRVSAQMAPPDADLGLPPDEDAPTAEAKGPGIDLSALESGVQQIGGMLKPDHVVSVLKLGKELLPSLFKGIGPVTMGKIGEQIVGKIVPAIGLAYQAGQVLYSLFAGDPEEERMRQDALRREQQEERRNQAIRELSESIAWEFRSTLVKVIDESIRSNFAEVNDKLKAIRGSFSVAQRERIEDRTSLVQAQTILKAYV